MTKTLQKNGLLSLLLLALVAGLYGQFLASPVLFDDLQFFTVDINGKLFVRDFRFAWLQLRGMPHATLAWTYALLGADLINFRIGNLVMHGMTVLALFFFLKGLFMAILGDQARSKASLGLSPQAAAFFAALFFALHPVATYAVGYLVQRSTVMATFFSLLALLSYVRGSVKQQAIWLWMCVPFYFLAVFSKEHVIMLPAALVALTILLHDDWRMKLKERWGIFLALAVVGMVVVLTLKGFLGSVYEVNASEMLSAQERARAYPLSVVTQCWLFFKYALLWLFPNSAWMSIDMREPFARSLISAYLLAVLAFAVWGFGAFWLLLRRGNYGLAGFALLFPWLMFFTEFSTVRLQEIFVLYRSYLWVVGAFCLLPLLMAQVNGRIAGVVLSLVALAMAPISMERLMVLSQPLFAWDDAEKLVKDHSDLPGAYRIYFNRGNERLELGMILEAQSDYKKAIELNPNFGGAMSNVAGTYTLLGDWKNAVSAYLASIEIDEKRGKSFALAYGNLGLSYSKLEEWPKAVEALSRAIYISHADGGHFVERDILRRAQAYEKLGDTQKSQADYKLACQLAKKGCDMVK